MYPASENLNISRNIYTCEGEKWQQHSSFQQWIEHLDRKLINNHLEEHYIPNEPKRHIQDFQPNNKRVHILNCTRNIPQNRSHLRSQNNLTNSKLKPSQVSFFYNFHIMIWRKKKEIFQLVQLLDVSSNSKKFPLMILVALIALR